MKNEAYIVFAPKATFTFNGATHTVESVWAVIDEHNRPVPYTVIRTTEGQEFILDDIWEELSEESIDL